AVHQEEAAALEADEAALGAGQDEEAAARVDAAERTQRVEGARRECARIGQALDEIDGRLAAARAEQDAAFGRGREAAEILRTTEEDLLARWALKRVKASEAASREEELASHRTLLQEQETALVTERSLLDRARAAAQDSEIARTRAESDRRFLDDL